ncbi:unnamed protein product [Sordaria macrospora k-hell]|uniref:WGS project CABT00000000 data, contig 2.38 n=1 Tax=Sordaria macrospora (strain ATCC MYA-333 / DSM 997 / K(L3346) / K-hell) TaxID=771870 RepID=F7W7B3_SORMK|nr:uncharacterized protein SMAC_06902 [Sordaria macrospora k-hell]CCC13404.1 unnamed protein product [Sordaria macrospora k-hell]
MMASATPIVTALPQTAQSAVSPTAQLPANSPIMRSPKSPHSMSPLRGPKLTLVVTNSPLSSAPNSAKVATPNISALPLSPGSPGIVTAIPLSPAVGNPRTQFPLTPAPNGPLTPVPAPKANVHTLTPHPNAMPLTPATPASAATPLTPAYHHPLTPAPGSAYPLSPAIETPSSTIVEYGEHPTLQGTAAERADHIFKLWTARNSKPKASQNDTAEAGDDLIISPVTPITPKQNGGLARKLGNKGINDRVSRFLASMSSTNNGDPDKELAIENRSLHQQLASLRRAEENLLAENQTIANQLTATQKEFAQAKKDRALLERAWEEMLKEREEKYEAKKKFFKQEQFIAMLEHKLTVHEDNLSEQDGTISQLEAKVAEQEKQIAERDERIAELEKATTPKKSFKSQPEQGLVLSNSDISTWFSTRTAVWNSWVDEFTHPNVNRIIELHPVQQKELFRSIQKFIRLTQEGQLPPELLDSAKNDGANVTRLILYAMLANFITSEALLPPFWAFNALQRNDLAELTSPTLTRPGSMSPVGFRMDLASWECIPPLPAASYVPAGAEVYNQQPATARSVATLSPRQPPPLITSLQSAGLETPGLSMGALPGKLPSEGDLKSMCGFLSKVQTTPLATPALRSQMISILAQGGLVHDPTHPSILKNEDRRLLAEARREYAVKLAERFLGGPARFLLQDQVDAKGIAKLEQVLTTEMDLALRFGARLWSVEWEVEFWGLDELSSLVQPEVEKEKREGVLETSGGEGVEVVMVLQPAVVRKAVESVDGESVLAEDEERVWSKARVWLGEKREIKVMETTVDVKTQQASPKRIASPAVVSPGTGKRTLTLELGS